MHDDQAALLAAAITAGPGAAPGDVTRQASAYLAWLAAPLHAAALHTGPTYHQFSAAPPRPTTRTPGGAVQLHDDEQVLITLTPKDAKGYTVTDDQVTYTPADPTVITCQPNGLSCLMVAGQPGSTTVAITDGTITYTWAADVVAGTAATFQVTEGTPEKQPAPAAPATPAATTPAAVQPAADSSTAAEGQPGQSPGRAAAEQAQPDDQLAAQSQDVAEHAGMTVPDAETPQ